MADKKLVISVDTKVSPEVKQLGKMLDDLAARGNKFARAVQGVSGVGPEGQAASKSGGLAKALLQEKKLFEDLGKSGERLAKVLNDQVTKSQATLTKQLEESTRKLDPLMKKYEAALSRVERMKSGGMDPKMLGVFQTHADRLGGDVMAAASEQRQAQAALDALKTPKGAGVMKQVMTALAAQIPALGAASSLGAAAGPWAAAMGTLFLGGQVARAVPIFNQSSLMSSASLGQTVSAMAGAGMGDAAQAWALSQAMGDPNRSLNKAMAMTGSAAGQMMDQLKLWRLFTDTGNYLGGFKNSVIENRMAEAAIGVDINDASARLAAQPMLRDLIGAKMGAAGRQVTAMRTLGMGPSALQQKYVDYAWGGLSPGQTEGVLARLGSMVGVGGAASLDPRGITNALRGGLSQETAIQLAAAGVMGGGSLINRATNLDLTTQNALGMHVAQSVLNPSSLMTSGEGYQGMLSAGLAGASPAMQQRLLAQNVAGAGAMSALFGGADAYQQSLNLVNAIDVLGPNTSLYAQSKLSKLGRDPKVLADILGGGAVPAALQGLGIGRGQVEEYANLTMGSVLNRYREAGGGGKGGELLEKLMKLGPGEQRRFLARQGQSSIDMMAGVLSEVAPEMFADEGAAAGFLRNWGGLGQRAAAGKRTDAAAGSKELSAFDAQIDTAVRRMESLTTVVGELDQAMKQAAQNISAAWTFERTAKTENQPVGPFATGSNLPKGKPK